ncbi:TPA: hypothetical protein ACVT6Z_003786 [Clostridioides difficile]|uniref:hypothetical protein n=1 Tax=Clostridioides difficile TaxID=1496 RepID=UPI00202E638A|nr:hypothetical protein [Clostridioides difficile]MCM0744062.1 hypothetical protein [Clostridioides difficile]MCP8387717.1 hypothetical protein [Clostridioides difficile]
MQIYFRVKAVGKRKPMLELTPFDVSGNINCLKEAISEIVSKNVLEYNEKIPEKSIINFLTNEEIESQADIGKVGFGSIYNENKQSVEKAIEVALQAFEDGIYKVLINEDVIEKLDSPINLKSGDIFTFIRLTLLAGRMF